MLGKRERSRSSLRGIIGSPVPLGVRIRGLGITKLGGGPVVKKVLVVRSGCGILGVSRVLFLRFEC
jgi:hypothetical protein